MGRAVESRTDHLRAAIAAQRECVCCSDLAKPARVVAHLPGGMAMAEIDGNLEEISLEVCDAAIGDLVLVHANVAIAPICANISEKGGFNG
jgi:hydrogenase maturation factor